MSIDYILAKKKKKENKKQTGIVLKNKNKEPVCIYVCIL